MSHRSVDDKTQQGVGNSHGVKSKKVFTTEINDAACRNAKHSDVPMAQTKPVLNSFDSTLLPDKIQRVGLVNDKESKEDSDVNRETEVNNDKLMEEINVEDEGESSVRTKQKKGSRTGKRHLTADAIIDIGKAEDSEAMLRNDGTLIRKQMSWNCASDSLHHRIPILKKQENNKSSDSVNSAVSSSGISSVSLHAMSEVETDDSDFIANCSGDMHDTSSDSSRDLSTICDSTLTTDSLRTVNSIRTVDSIRTIDSVHTVDCVTVEGDKSTICDKDLVFGDDRGVVIDCNDLSHTKDNSNEVQAVSNEVQTVSHKDLTFGGNFNKSSDFVDINTYSTKTPSLINQADSIVRTSSPQSVSNENNVRTSSPLPANNTDTFEPNDSRLVVVTATAQGEGDMIQITQSQSLSEPNNSDIIYMYDQTKFSDDNCDFFSGSRRPSGQRRRLTTNQLLQLRKQLLLNATLEAS